MAEYRIRSDEERAAAAARRDAAMHLRESRESLPLGIVGGLSAAVVGGAAWGGVTVATGYQIGWLAVGVGFLVGCSVRLLGRGSGAVFGLVGAGCALLGCLLGNLFATCSFLASELSVPYFTVLGKTLASPSLAMELMKMGFGPMDVLFYAIALYEGQKFATLQGD